MAQPLIQSHVHHGDTLFFVSTINRQSSAVEAPVTYAETLVWECDPITRVRGRLIHSDSDAANTIRTHLTLCQRLHETGHCGVDA